MTIPNFAVSHYLADIGFDLLFPFRVACFLGFELHAVRSPAQCSHRNPLGPFVNGFFQRLLWNEGVDKGAIKRFGYAPKGFELDCSICFGFLEGLNTLRTDVQTASQLDATHSQSIAYRSNPSPGGRVKARDGLQGLKAFVEAGADPLELA